MWTLWRSSCVTDGCEGKKRSEGNAEAGVRKRAGLLRVADAQRMAAIFSRALCTNGLRGYVSTSFVKACRAASPFRCPR